MEKKQLLKSFPPVPQGRSLLQGWKSAFLLFLLLTACKQEPTQTPENWTHIPMVNAHEDDSQWFTEPKPDQLFQLQSPEHTGLHFSNDFEETFSNNFWVFMYHSIGAGIGAGDFNQDGLCDLYFSGSFVPNRLYLNRGNLQFEDVTELAEVGDSTGFSTGVTVLDINQDGLLDIYQCKTGAFEPQDRTNKLYINQGDGTFRDEAKAYGLDIADYSTHANFFDYDKDGDLDVYLLTHPIDFNDRNLISANTKLEKGTQHGDRFFRNDGQNHFEEVTAEVGIKDHGFGLSCSVGDLNGDDWPDVYVANDFMWQDLVYLNNQDGTFRQALTTAVKKTSRYAMGTDLADFNNDGLIDLATADIDMETNYGRKTDRGNSTGWGVQEFENRVHSGYHYQYPRNTLQINNGDGTFSEIANYAGTSTSDWTWAMLFADFDNDGWKDLFVSNGFYMEFDEDHKDQHKDLGQAIRMNDPASYFRIRMEMPRAHLKFGNDVFRNNGDYTFTRMTQAWGTDLPTVSHGAVYADLDNDGDLDLVASNTNQAVSLYENRSEQLNRNHYLKIALASRQPDLGLGAQITLTLPDSSIQFRQYSPVKGYQSTVEPLLHFGLGTVEVLPRVTVVWPDGKTQHLTAVPTNQTLTLAYENARMPEALPPPPSPAASFSNQTQATGLTSVHRENEYDDFAGNFLLHHKQSRFGPGIAVGDVDGDGLDDLFVGGALGQAPELWQQRPNGSFTRMEEEYWANEASFEDMGALFFDANGDGKKDLYVASGSVEPSPGDSLLQDRFYLNLGRGQFKKQPLAVGTGNSFCVSAADFDGDGDLDLFVGGRAIPKSYPHPDRSWLLRNDGAGHFTDVTAELAPELVNPGRLSCALWTDFDNDDRSDLILAGEWMPLRFFRNTPQGFVEITSQTGLPPTSGWWNSLIGSDFDQDGLEDLVMSYYNFGKRYPTQNFRYLGEKMPVLVDEIQTYARFGHSTLKEIFASHGLDQATHLKAEELGHLYLENKGSGKFTTSFLPPRAQFAPIMGMVPAEVNGDGFPDLLLHGNSTPLPP